MRTPHATLVRVLVLLVLLGAQLEVLAAERAVPRVLVYSYNQVGTNLYVHDNISAATEALVKLGRQGGFDADVSNDPKVFTPQKLARYRAIVFNNTNNEILESEEQKTALQEFVRKGGGVVGIHSATGSMRRWPWFWSLMGGKFKRHPKLQPFTVRVKDPSDISTAHFPASFTWTDEFYYVDPLKEGLHVLLAGELASLDDPLKGDYPGQRFGEEFPLAWRQEFEGGRSWYTALGHKPEHYEELPFQKHLLGGILWVMGAESKTEP